MNPIELAVPVHLLQRLNAHRQSSFNRAQERQYLVKKIPFSLIIFNDVDSQFSTGQIPFFDSEQHPPGHQKWYSTVANKQPPDC